MPPTDPNKKEEIPSSSELSQIRTFQGDVAHALHDQNESLVSIRASELAKKERFTESTHPQEERNISLNIFLLILGFIFLVGGSVGGYFTYNKYQQKVAVPTIIAPLNRFFPVSSESELNTLGLTRETFISSVLALRGEGLTPLQSRHIELRKGVDAFAPLTSLTEFFLIMNAGAPGNLVRSLDSLFMLGTLEEAGTQTFLIFKINSYENAYAGMLAWEESLGKDLLPLFLPPEVLSTLPAGVFEDFTIKNKDVRAIKSAEGKIVFLYTFYNQKLLILTSSEGALRNILSKLDTESLTR